MSKKQLVWRFIIAVVVFVVVSEIVNTVGSILAMGYYQDPAYFSVWSKIMMPVAGPPPASFFYYSILFNLIGGFFFVWVYSILKSAVPGNNLWVKGLKYGALIFLVGSLSGFLMLVLLINLPLGLIVYWAAGGLVVSLLSGMFTAKIIS